MVEIKMRVLQLLLLEVTISTIAANAKYDYTGNGETREFWNQAAADELRKAKNTKPNIAVAKNVILFLGDGMGVSTVTAARILKGQQQGQLGEESVLSFEKFPYVGLSKTYNQNGQTPDSAGTATAFVSGVKTNFGVLGVDGRSRRGECDSLPGTELESMADWAKAQGKSVGIVTTTRVTHATPASLYAKIPERDWECDTDMIKENVTGPCKDIASQLIDNYSDVNVILGGGRIKFLRNNDTDPESGKISNYARSDGRNLIEEWMQKQSDLDRTHSYVWNASAFHDVDPYTTDYLLGLFASSHMQYTVDRNTDVGGEPTLPELVNKALQILSRNPKGYFLLVEGGRIDHGHHSSKAHKALTEAVEFADAVEKAVNMTSEKDTLMVVTADHSHVFTIAGYPSRGNPLFGLADDHAGSNQYAEDDKPYTTLQYSNGPGGYVNITGGIRPNITDDVTDHKDYIQQSGVPLDSETHAGEDVAIYASGPMSHLIHGVHEQSYIAHVMSYASCIGRYSNPESCALADVEDVQSNTSNGVSTRFDLHLPLVILAFTLLNRL